MVGVPRLVWCESGRSTWMSWPRLWRRKLRIASGVPTSPTASATAAATRIPTTLGPLLQQALGHALEGDHAARLDQDHVAGGERSADGGDGRVGVGDGGGLLRPHALHARRPDQ